MTTDEVKEILHGPLFGTEAQQKLVITLCEAVIEAREAYVGLATSTRAGRQLEDEDNQRF